MSDDYNISYSYQVNPAPGPVADDSLIAFTNCAKVDLGNGSVLLLNRDNGRQLAIAPEVFTALTYCSTFKTLQEHARTLAETLPQLRGQVDDVTKVLTMVNEAGLLLHAQTIIERCSPQPIPEQALAPTRAFIITCDRPAALERLLDSMLHSCKLDRHQELFLVDDSRDPDNAQQNRELVAKFNRSSVKTMHYAGAAAQRQLMDSLIAAHPDDEAAIRFLIDRGRWAAQKSYGLARTVCLLLSVGYRCIVLDDDVLCQSVLPPNRGEGITFGGGANRELACFASRQELLQGAAYGDTDPLSGHARCLGMHLAQAVNELHGADIGTDSLHRVNAMMLNTLRADSRILVTQCGSWGDPGVPGSNWFAQLGQESIKRVLAAPGGLSGTLQNRHYWLGRSRPNISKMAVMSQATGLDNSQLLPPYFPVLRGEDYLFASMLLYLHPAAAVLDYDWSIPHLPLEPHNPGDTHSPIPSRGGLALAARHLADRVDYAGHASPDIALQQLALLLQDLGERDPASLLATFRTELAQEQADALRQLTKQLEGAPALGDRGWEDFLRRGVADITAAVQSPASPLGLPGAPAGLDETALLQQIRTGLGEFGRAVAAWPNMRLGAATATSQMLDTGDLLP